MATRSEEKTLSRAITEKLLSGNETLFKEGSASIDRFIRTKFKERSYFNKIIDPKQLTVDDLFDHPTRTDKLWYKYEYEPDCPGVLEMAYNTPAPIMTYNARKALISIDRIQSVRLRKETNELIQWSVSLSDIAADMQLKEIEYAIDGRATNAINISVGIEPFTVMRSTGSVQHYEVDDSLTRTALAHSLNYIPNIGEENGLNAKTLLMNNITFNHIAAWSPNEAGEDFTTDILKNGLGVVEDGLFGLKFIVTIKKKLVPHGVVYYLGDTKYVGANVVWKEPTMIIKQHDFSVEFGTFYEGTGAILAFLGIAKAKYLGVGV
jgi:hypothetical protein